MPGPTATRNTAATRSLYNCSGGTKSCPDACSFLCTGSRVLRRKMRADEIGGEVHQWPYQAQAERQRVPGSGGSAAALRA